MSEKYFRKISAYFISLVVIFVFCHLLWEHLNGGVVSHHLLNRADYPSISNWWGIIILPCLAWFSATRIKKRIRFHSDAEAAADAIPNGILAGFFTMLVLSALQSGAFLFGYEDVTLYLLLTTFAIGLFFPLYRAEAIVGHVLGSAFVFGPVIPLIVVLIIATVSALSNVCLKPMVLHLARYLSGSRSIQDSEKKLPPAEQGAE